VPLRFHPNGNDQRIIGTPPTRITDSFQASSIKRFVCPLGCLSCNTLSGYLFITDVRSTIYRLLAQRTDTPRRTRLVPTMQSKIVGERGTCGLVNSDTVSQYINWAMTVLYRTRSSPVSTHGTHRYRLWTCLFIVSRTSYDALSRRMHEFYSALANSMLHVIRSYRPSRPEYHFIAQRWALSTMWCDNSQQSALNLRKLRILMSGDERQHEVKKS